MSFRSSGLATISMLAMAASAVLAASGVPVGSRGLAGSLAVAGSLVPAASIASAAPGGAPVEAVTFSKDIAPILFARCALCHNPNGSAPFSVLSYSAAKQRASLIASATKSRFMPPWKAEPVSGDFIGQQRLSDGEIDLIQRWVDGGAPEGDPRDLPPQPHIASGWELGKPDLIVSLPQAYTLPGEGSDVFRIFVIPLPTDRVRYVRGLEFHPGNPKVVHHANIRIDRTSASRTFDDQDPAPGYEGLMARSAVYPDGHFLGWTPGQVAPLLPKGLAWRLDRGTDLVVELHMQPSGKPELVQPTVGLFFGDDPPERTPLMLRLGRQNIDIAAGAKNYTITDSFVVPVDVDVQAVQPHAHYLAREVRGVATLPDGSTRTLIYIKDWDFRWQHVYRYVTPFTLPKGTTLAMRYTFDNSADNPRNPQQPPQRVRWGQRSRDEMGDLWIQVLTRNDRDLETLTRAFRPKVLAEDTFGYEREIERDPSSVALHDDVAQLYLQLGRASEAVVHFEASVRLSPQSAATHFNLGTALTVAGRFDEAIEQYRTALQLNPGYPRAHNNLGSVLMERGNLQEAMAQFTDALRLEPANVEARSNLAVAYASAGEFERAVELVQTALQLAPLEPLATLLRDHLELYKQRRAKPD
jgi:Flp pilus assembly protein TadD